MLMPSGLPLFASKQTGFIYLEAISNKKSVFQLSIIQNVNAKLKKFFEQTDSTFSSTLFGAIFLHTEGPNKAERLPGCI